MAFTEPIYVPNSGNADTFNRDMDYFAGWWALFAAELNEAGYPNLPQMFRVNGTMSAPAQSWDADPDTGMYRPGADQIAWSTGGVTRWRLSNVEAELSVPLTGNAVQSGPLDQTPTRLMRVGAFGLGGVSPLIGNASVTNNSIAPGRYAYETANGSSGGPAGIVTGNLWHSRRAMGGGEAQIIVSDTPGLSGATYTRARTTGAWSAWTRLDVERISNANGTVTRLSDGLQICTHILSSVPDPGTAWGNLYISSETIWNFPAEFAAAPFVDASVRFSGGLFGKGRPNGTLSASISLIAGQPLTATRAVDVIAIGRWF